MASSSAVSSMALKEPLKNYDVFISFRGEDSVGNFTSHLHAALCRNNIETYNIEQRMEKGDDEVWEEVEEAIKESSVFLVIFSENYASSRLCLNELVEIMECNNRKNNEEGDVIPVFYRIEPSQVRKQTKSYQKALSKHKKDSKMPKWREALSEAANISGFHSHAYSTENALIEDIIKVVLQKLNQKYTNDFRSIFISDENYTELESLLETDSNEARIIGIWGMGGIGKTTLAAAIFHKTSSEYGGTCFLENVTEESKRYGLNYVCSRLVSKLLMEDLHIDTPKVVPSSVLRRLRRKKVFIVLDDVNTSELLESLIGVGRDWLGAGSRVIVTTRDKHVLIGGGVDAIHEVMGMNFENSLMLFSLNAFNKAHPEEGYEELSEKAVAYAKGVPLALKVLGSFLRSKSEKEWDSALTKLKEIPDAEIQKVLRLSYNELDEAEKNIFLDIACFFKGYGRNKVAKILNACGFFADIGIRNLLDKALVTTTSYNLIEMHDLIQEMGRNIVREECVENPGRRSRLWDPEEVHDVLTNNRGTDAIEGIQLDMTQITYINLCSKAFEKMPNLRLLVFEILNKDFMTMNSVYLPKGLQSLPKSLRYFWWNAYPLKSLPPAFCPKKLVELSMPYSNVETLWNGVQNLPSLERIDLRESPCLKDCPNFSLAPNLKHVILGKCESLAHVDPSIFTLQKLVELDVSGCKSLKRLCSSTCSPSLQRFYAWGCINLQEFTVMPPNDPSTTGFSLNSLHIRNLEIFSFPISDSLADLPENFADQITLSDSGKDVCDTFIILHSVLPSSCFRNVKRLFFAICYNLWGLPNNISMLSSLEYLVLFFCTIISLPESIKDLPKLKFLEICECKKLRHIPALPESIECFFVYNSESLQSVLSSPCEPSKQQNCTFLLPNCINLDENSFHAILQDAIDKIKLGAKPLSAAVSEKEEDEYLDDDDGDYYNDLYNNFYIVDEVTSGEICYMLPAVGCKTRDWFHYRSTQSLVTVDEIPPNHLGFFFYLVLSQVQPYHIGYRGSFGCECYLETSRGESINITSFFVGESVVLNPHTLFEIMSDHVFLWYDAQCCKQIMEAVKQRKGIDHNDRSTTHSPKLTFQFFAQTQDNVEAVIKECGYHWIYPSEDKIVEEGRECKSKKSREIHELEATVIETTRKGSESDEQEETVPSIEKFNKCVFRTPSTLLVEETEDLRRLLEELLHIGFGGDLMQGDELQYSE